MSTSWSLLVFVSLNYCAEKRLLKTHVAFFMKVTVCGSDGYFMYQIAKYFVVCTVHYLASEIGEFDKVIHRV